MFEDDVFIENTRPVAGSKTQDLNLRADIVLDMSRGSPGQWFPETEYWASTIFEGTSGIPPKIIYRSVKSYSIEKWTTLIMKSGKRCATDGMEQPNQEKIRTLGEKRKVQILGNIESGDHQISGGGRRTGKLLEVKQYSRKPIKGINIRAVHLVRYSRPFLEWTREELQKIDKSTYRTLHHYNLIWAVCHLFPQQRWRMSRKTID